MAIRSSDRAPQPAESPSRGGSIDLRLEVFGEEIHTGLALPDGPTRLAELVPPARVVADQIVAATVRRAARSGQAVSCHKGCAACCHYLVPLSAPEALCLRQEIQALSPVRQRRIAGQFEAAARRVLGSRPSELRDFPPTQADGMAPDKLEKISSWYSSLELPCPLLANNVCALYPRRPIACREHLVVSPPQHCTGGQGRAIQRSEVPFSVSEALGRLAAEVEGTSLEALPMTVALEWCQVDPPRARRTWPGPMLLERFAAILGDLAVKAAASASPAA